MSELKVYAPYDYSHEPDRCPSLVYDKSEVDKVIAEKDAEIAELKEQIQKECLDKVNYKISAHDLSDGLKEAYEDLWHQKYKRCLNMAWWCNAKGDWYYSLGELFKSEDDAWRRGLCEAFRKHVDFYIKWRDKWFKIAERFKEKPTW